MYISHIYQILVLFILVLVEIIFQFNLLRKSSFKAIQRILLKRNIAFECFVLSTLVQVYLFNVRNFRLIDAHWAYYFGIPAEMLKGTYSNRIKIFDNFPIEYPKYHFFNGSELAILMRPLEKIVYADYALTKIVLLSALIALGLELFNKTKSTNRNLPLFALFVLMALTVLNSNLNWALNSSNYSAIAFFVLFVISMLKRNTEQQIIWLSIFSMTSARSLLPALFLLIYISAKPILNIVKKKSVKVIELKHLFLLLLLIINWNVMLLSGANPGSSLLDIIKSQLSIPYQNLVNPGWLTIMSSGVFGSPINSMTWCFLWISTLILIFSVSGNLMSKARILTLAATILVGLTFVIRYFEVPKAIQLSSLILNFAIPIFSVLVLSPRHCRRVIAIFLIVSLAQILLLDGGQSIPNWALVEWLWLCLLIYWFNANYISSKKIIVFFLLIASLSLSFFSSNELSDLYQANQNNDTAHLVSFDQVNFGGQNYCELDDLHGLLNSLAGNRSYYKKSKSDRYSITKIFIGNLESEEIKGICP
jgi:hypothetical protein